MILEASVAFAYGLWLGWIIIHYHRFREYFEDTPEYETVHAVIEHLQKKERK